MSEEKIIRVLYIGVKYDYGDPKRGLSHEYVNFFNTLEKMEHIQAESFFYDEVLVQKGLKAMNELLIAVVQEKPPDICFFVLFTDEITKETIRWISEKSGAKTFNWFSDDHWRFELHSKEYAPLFHWIVTTDHDSVEHYRQIGCNNVILSQWAFNSYADSPKKNDYAYDVTFVGQVHSTRREIITKLQSNNIKIVCWGRGWKNGRISSEAMKQKFMQSKINLNFTSSANTLNLKRLAKVILHRRSDSTYHMNTPINMIREIQTLYRHQRPQIKGRNFEIPGHGGFLLTEFVDGIDQYFIPDKEIVLFKNFDELVGKISLYLKNDEQREAIRLAGQARTLNEHTYEQRFRKIFHTVIGPIKN